MDPSVLKNFIASVIEKEVRKVTIETTNGKTYKGEIKEVDDIGLLLKENVNRERYLVYYNIVSII